MKKAIIIALTVFTAIYHLSAQTTTEPGGNMSKKFVASMETNLGILDTASTTETYIMLANNFERIGKAEQKQWQPFYYASFCYAIMAGDTPDKSKIDFLADKAESYLNKADEIEKNNSEISSLKAMVLYIRVLVDPVSRWQTMGAQAAGYLSMAKQQNPANPRPWLIEARTKLYTPESLGGGPKAAAPTIEECMNKYKAFVPENSIAPDWGKGQAKKMMQATAKSQ